MRTLLILLALSYVSFARGCSCVTDLIVDRVESSGFIAAVTILDTRPVDTLDGYHRVKIRIEELYKGTPRTEILLHSQLNSSCAFLPRTGSQWLLFAQTFQGKLSFSYCSGNEEITRTKWAGATRANRNHYAGVSRVIGFLRYLRANDIEPTNTYGLGIGYTDDADQLRGYANPEQDFALFRIRVDEDLNIRKVTGLKRFANRKLDRAIRRGIRASGKAYRWKWDSIPTATEVYLAVFYYGKEGDAPSFVSCFDL
ncbi:hypothetical protein [Lewinella sp. IMCC34183]|uniref:hypothetical protein n=1 Tax=Lewinella sp. IMCC34183 TaxID=2248762 RepID=UPI001300B47E|nr:hypothetical protein [Lewinella sp. IMCC34183]